MHCTNLGFTHPDDYSQMMLLVPVNQRNMELASDVLGFDQEGTRLPHRARPPTSSRRSLIQQGTTSCASHTTHARALAATPRFTLRLRLRTPTQVHPAQSLFARWGVRVVRSAVGTLRPIQLYGLPHCGFVSP